MQPDRALEDAARPPGEGDGSPRAAVIELHDRLHRVTGMDLPVRLWDGTELGSTDAPYRLVLQHPGAVRALVRPPFDLSMGEAYAGEALDIEGDIESAIGAGERFTAMMSARQWLRSVGDVPAIVQAVRALPPADHTAVRRRRATLKGRMHTPERDRAAIAFHYDLPQAFYESFLDEGLVYSCAAFEEPDEPLEAAQERKLDMVCRKLRLQPGMKMLDVGCGWGTLIIHAAEHYGVQALGVTLSQTQADAGRKRIAERGLSDRVEIRLADYREVDEQFDAVASVGMLEHVGPSKLDDYHRRLWRMVAPGGLLLDHGIVMGDAARVRRGDERTFVTAHVFPDGGLVPAWRLVQSAQLAGFELLDVQQLRPNYALTLREWGRRLDRNRDAAVAAASEMDYRVWRMYLAASAYSFANRSLGVVQVLVGRDAEVPLGRRWTLPER